MKWWCSWWWRWWCWWWWRWWCWWWWRKWCWCWWRWWGWWWWRWWCWWWWRWWCWWWWRLWCWWWWRWWCWWWWPMGLFPGLKSKKSVLSRTGVWTMGTPKRPYQLLFWLKPAPIALNHVSPCITWFQALGAKLMQNPGFCNGFHHNGYTKTAISTLIPAQTCAERFESCITM